MGDALVETLIGTLTNTTCGLNCWAAREAECRCSCGGQFHGAIDRGEQTVRTRKLNGWLYILCNVEDFALYLGSCRAASMRPLQELAYEIGKAACTAGMWEQHHFSGTPGYPAKLKTASESEVTRWPEFMKWKRKGYGRPLGLWVRTDIHRELGL